MIEDGKGNLLTAEADALVNTVNTVGVMGKGIALQFKRAFPDNHAAYRTASDRGELAIGRILVFDTGMPVGTIRPAMTRGRAALLVAADRYLTRANTLERRAGVSEPRSTSRPTAPAGTPTTAR